MEESVKKENDIKKEFLLQYRTIQSKITDLEQQKEAVEIAYKSAKALQYSDMPKGGNKESDLSDYIVKIEQLQELIDEKTLELQMKKFEIETCIASVPDGVESLLLRKRYLELKKWDVICEEMEYSERQIYYIHSRALKNFKIA